MDTLLTIVLLNRIPFEAANMHVLKNPFSPSQTCSLWTEAEKEHLIYLFNIEMREDKKQKLDNLNSYDSVSF